MAIVSRRNLITQGALAAVGALVALPDLAKAAVSMVAGGPKPTGLGASATPWLSRPHLAPHVGDTFQLELEGRGTVAMQLTRVDDVACATTAGLSGSPDCFTAIFAAAEPIPQGTHTIRHRAMGRFELFLVPAGTIGDRHSSTATINRAHA